MSIVTGTGFAGTDYLQWGGCVAVFFALMFTGGVRGQRRGVKIFRYCIAWSLFISHVRRLISPHVVEVQRYGERRIGEDVAVSVLLFFVYIAGQRYPRFGRDRSGLGYGLFRRRQHRRNIGPGLSRRLGRPEIFKDFLTTKWVLSSVMLLGRLEFSVTVLFFWSFWRD